MTYVFFLAGDNDPEYVPPDEYLNLVRGNAFRQDLARQTVRVADWYTRSTEDGVVVENETYTFLAFDGNGRADVDLLDRRHPAGWEPSAEEVDKMMRVLDHARKSSRMPEEK